MLDHEISAPGSVFSKKPESGSNTSGSLRTVSWIYVSLQSCHTVKIFLNDISIAKFEQPLKIVRIH